MENQPDLSMEEFLELQNEAIQKYPYKFSTCFFHQGYVRQPLFLCLDCSPKDASQFGAMCYSCSISCHSSHKIIELGHRRNFRCECGNRSCFTSNCILNPESHRDERDVQNYANLQPHALHNFSGKFCYCNQEFDEFHQEPDSFMLQCRLCEDWFHSHCLHLPPEKIPSEEQFEEFFCMNCINSSNFLGTFYFEMQWNSSEIGEKSLCFGKIHPNENQKPNFELFCNLNWQEQVCKCTKNCFELLKRDPMGIFLIHQEPEWIPEPEVVPETIDYENAVQSLNQMDRSVALRGIYACKEFSKSLKAFLQPFAEGGKVVTKEDIQEFFANKMSQR